MDENKWAYLIEQGIDYLVFKGEKPNTIVFVFASCGYNTAEPWLDEYEVDLKKFDVTDPEFRRLSLDKQRTIINVVEELLKKEMERLKEWEGVLEKYPPEVAEEIRKAYFG